MKPFRFRAERLLHLRRQRRDEAQTLVASAERAAHAAAADLARGIDAKRVAAERYVASLRADGDPELFARHRNWIRYLTENVSQLETTANARTDDLSKARAALRLAHQHVRVLERLRERAHARHEAAVREQEMKELDQIATLQHARRFHTGGR